MTTLIETFAGGISFALGAFVGTGVIAYFMRHNSSETAKKIIDSNRRIEARMYDQVGVLRRIANHLDGGKK